MFTPAPAALRNKTYPLRVIIEALTTYSLGYSHAETSRRVRTKMGRATSDSTLSAWIAEHHDLLSSRRLREDARKRIPPEQTVRSVKLYHRQSVSLLVPPPEAGIVARERGACELCVCHKLLESIPLICPHELIRTEDAGGRASQAQPAFADVSRIIVNRKENAATRAAALIIPTVGNNRERHERSQQFMLANDSVTLAVEVPIWLTENDIAVLEEKFGIELVPHTGNVDRVVTGHMDFCKSATAQCTSWIMKPSTSPNRTPVTIANAPCKPGAQACKQRRELRRD